MTLGLVGRTLTDSAPVRQPKYRRTASRPHRIAPLLILVMLLVLPLADGPLTAVSPSTLPPAPVVSGMELDGNLSLARDCGYSAPLPADPGTSLWLFCDTPVYQRQASASGDGTWALHKFIAGSTAAVATTVAGPGPSSQVPGLLSEVRTPRLVPARTAGGIVQAGAPALAGAGATSVTPAPFLAAPADLFTSAGRPCGLGSGSYAASWISGVAQVPSTGYLLISFNDYCVLGSAGGFLYEGFGLAEYDPASGTLSNDATVFSGAASEPGSAPLGSPVFSGGYLYLFAPTCSAPEGGSCAGTVLEARVAASPNAWSDPLSYQWLSAGPSGPWTPDAAAATAVVPGPWPTGLSVAQFPAARRKLVLIEEVGIEGYFTVHESAEPGGTWTTIRSGRVACRAGSGYANFCRALIGHPELSTPAQLVLSYFDPVDGPGGHVMVEGFSW